jgi:hypothetical protein
MIVLFALRPGKSAALVLETIANQQICALDRPGGVWEVYRDPFLYPSACDRSDAQSAHDTVIEAGPVVAGHAVKSALPVPVARLGAVAVDGKDVVFSE